MRRWGSLRKAALHSSLALFVVALSAVSASGEPVDGHRAALAAKGWYELRFRHAQELKVDEAKRITALAAEAARPIVVGGRTIAYAFDVPGGGCIAIAADDRLAPVFYYSLERRLTVPGVPPAQAIMEAFAENIVQAQDDPDSRAGTAHPLWASLAGLSGAKGAVDTLAEFPSAAKGPLLTTTWDQIAPYNDKCPMYQGQRCLTGCVATAMAQVMRYWQHPAKGTGRHCYTWYVTYCPVCEQEFPYCEHFDSWVLLAKGSLCADFGSTTYDWANMPEQVTWASLPAVKDAVSTLCYHCGVAVEMDYGPDWSGAWEYMYTALRRYFGYGYVRYGGRPDSTREEWYDMMCEQIDRGQPVLYCTALHAFVLDGYDSPDLVHFNFGWGGEDDGWYPIGAPNAGLSQDIGDPPQADAVIDIRPQQSGTFWVMGTQPDPVDGAMVISWMSQVGKTYQVYYTDKISQNPGWTPLGEVLAGTGGLMSVKDSGARGREAPSGSSVKQRFYRVEER